MALYQHKISMIHIGNIRLCSIPLPNSQKRCTQAVQHAKTVGLLATLMEIINYLDIATGKLVYVLY